MLLALTVLTGLAYPLATTGVAQVLFPHQANGSLVRVDGQPVGSALLGQGFTRPEYFHPRPSAAGEGYDAAASSGSNLGPTNRRLSEAVQERLARVRKDNGLAPETRVPADLVTASASGLDPHLSPEAALLQVRRVAQARQLPAEQVRQLVLRHVRGPQFGVLGEPRVNVLELNLRLAQINPPGR
jgi:K+-transporting ATPase ATPase C chain